MTTPSPVNDAFYAVPILFVGLVIFFTALAFMLIWWVVRKVAGWWK